MGEHQVFVGEETLCGFITELFEQSGMGEPDAARHARALVDTDLWGVSSHGTMRAPAYFERMKNGAINVKPNIGTVAGDRALEVMDGDGGAGILVGHRAMERAMELAKEYRIGAVGVKNSNHFGAGGIYARMAAEQGMIGIAMTNVMPLVAAPGAKLPVVGNNPIAIGIPTFAEFPFCLDMALSKVAGGKLTLAVKRGEAIPPDWATDADGHPTTDPAEALKGYLLPVGDYKGLGLAYVVDILCGVITGGVFSHQMKSMYADPRDPSLTGHFFLAIDIGAVIGRETMRQRMEEYNRQLKATPMWDENKEMLLPGELEYRKSIELRRTGIPVPIKTFEELTKLGKQYGLKSQLTPRP